MRRRDPESELRDFARLQVRAGLLTDAEQYDAVREAVAVEMPQTDPAIMARAWLAAGRQAQTALEAGWPEVTDHDRLEAAFIECEAHHVPVLRGLGDHVTATEFLLARTERPRGLLWFTQAAVWHAIDEGLLEVNLWHGTGADVVLGDDLVPAVLSCLERHGLRARFAGGRIEVATHWQRRLGQ